MAVNEKIQTGRKFRKLIDEDSRLWLRFSFWTKAGDVEFDDGERQCFLDIISYFCLIRLHPTMLFLLKNFLRKKKPQMYCNSFGQPQNRAEQSIYSSFLRSSVI